MIRCDQFIYTSALTERKKGYQIIAKSDGISDKIISDLEGYQYPLGTNLNELKESRALLILGRTKVAYSIIKIGIGYDGRSGTIFNHTFVIATSDFEKLGFDSRVFENYFIKDSSVRSQLNRIQIDSKKIPINFELLKKLDKGVLEEMLHRLLTQNKIALVKTDEVFLLQNLLALIPPHLRLISFSTMVNDPKRQPQYELIQVPQQTTSKLDKSFAIINPTDKPQLTARSPSIANSVKTLVDIIMSKDEQTLSRIYKDYELFSEQSSKTIPIKVKELFDKTELEDLLNEKNFSEMKNKVQKLYSSEKFNQAPPTVIVSITRKIRKIIEKSLKKITRLEKKGINVSRMDIISILKILLDSMNYLQRYSNKKKNPTVENKISEEKMVLEELLSEISTKEPEVAPYSFDIQEYWKSAFQYAWDSAVAFTLWATGRR